MMRNFGLALAAAGLFLMGCGGSITEVKPEKMKKGEVTGDADAAAKGMAKSFEMMQKGPGARPEMAKPPSAEDIKAQMEAAKKK